MCPRLGMLALHACTFGVHMVLPFLYSTHLSTCQFRVSLPQAPKQWWKHSELQYKMVKGWYQTYIYVCMYIERERQSVCVCAPAHSVYGMYIYIYIYYMYPYVYIYTYVCIDNMLCIYTHMYTDTVLVSMTIYVVFLSSPFCTSMWQRKTTPFVSICRWFAS